jgi:hypothetical protein
VALQTMAQLLENRPNATPATRLWLISSKINHFITLA